MPEQTRSLADVDWRHLLPWWSLVRVFRLALDPRKLALAAVAMLLTVVGWWGVDWVFSASDDINELIAAEPAAPWSDPFFRKSADSAAGALGEMTMPAVEPNAGWFVRSPVPDSWLWLSRPFRRLFDVGLTITGFVYWLVSGLWVALVWGFFGSAITRIAALELTREDRLGLGAALRHSRTKLGAYFWCPVYPLLGTAILALPMILLGWLLRFDVGLLLVAIIWPLFLFCGFLMAIGVIVFLFGWPLMWPTISTEGSDTFDALSRTLAYVIQRPLHYLFYVVVATVLGVLGWIVVAIIAAAVVQLSFWGVSWTSGGPRAAELVNGLPAPVRMFVWQASVEETGAHEPAPATNGDESDAEPPATSSDDTSGGPAFPPAATNSEEPGGPAFPPTDDAAMSEPDASDAAPESGDESDDESAGALAYAGLAVLAFWIALVKVLAIGFGLSYFWTASTAVYLLMRRAVDATEMDEVFVEDEEEQYTLPPITADSQGAPVADDSESQGPSEAPSGPESGNAPETPSDESSQSGEEK